MTQSNPMHTEEDFNSNKKSNDRIQKNAIFSASILTGVGLLFIIASFVIGNIVYWQDYVLIATPPIIFIMG